MNIAASEDEPLRDDRSRAAFGPFDPTGMISDLQAQGIRAATETARRLTDMLDSTASPPHRRASSRSDHRTAVGDLRGVVGRAVDLYSEVLQRTFDAYADLIEERARVSPHLDGGLGDGVHVEIACTARNQPATGELWLSNDTDTATGRLRLVPTDLAGTSGCVPAARVTLSPSSVDLLAAETTIRIAVSIYAGPATPPGYYHGYVLVAELPSEALPITLVVSAPPNQDGLP